MYIKYILFSALLITAGFAQSQTTASEPFLSADEIDSLTLTPEEYEEKYEEEIDTDDYETNPDSTGETCGLSGIMEQTHHK
ncbi:MAG: hypothetical protein V3V13_04745 [Paracoccaceae bacterium]